jgi:ABC-2 type transport system ATP-binding protein
MEATADRIIDIGRGQLIADTTIAEFPQRSTQNHVRVVTPDASSFWPVLQRAGATITVSEGALIVTAGCV